MGWGADGGLLGGNGGSGGAGGAGVAGFNSSSGGAGGSAGLFSNGGDGGDTLACGTPGKGGNRGALFGAHGDCRVERPLPGHQSLAGSGLTSLSDSAVCPTLRLPAPGLVTSTSAPVSST